MNSLESCGGDTTVDLSQRPGTLRLRGEWGSPVVFSVFPRTYNHDEQCAGSEEQWQASPTRPGEPVPPQVRNNLCFNAFPHAKCVSAFFIRFLRLRLMRVRWEADTGVWETKGSVMSSKFTKHGSKCGFNTPVWPFIRLEITLQKIMLAWLQSRMDAGIPQIDFEKWVGIARIF